MVFKLARLGTTYDVWWNVAWGSLGLPVWELEPESCRGPLSLAKAVPVMKRCVVTAQKPSLPNPAIRHSREIIPLVTNTPLRFLRYQCRDCFIMCKMQIHRGLLNQGEELDPWNLDALVMRVSYYLLFHFMYAYVYFLYLHAYRKFWVGHQKTKAASFQSSRQATA